MKQSSSGYTLLELVVVMAILAMGTALAAPTAYRMIRSWQESTEIDDVFLQLERLPILVRADGAPLTVKASGGIPLVQLPDNWSLRMTEPIRVLPNGFCSDARGVLATPSQSIYFRIQSPFCQVERL